MTAYVAAHPDQAEAVYEAEATGKDRSTLIAAITPYLDQS